MKLFKKVLAAALAGVLALSVLTGCNNSAATVTMVDALNDWSKVYGVGTTFKKGDEKLQSQVNVLAEIVNEAGKDIGSEDIKNLEDVYDAVMNNEAARLKLQEWAKQFAKAKIGDGSPLYQYGFADISLTLSAGNKNKNIYYANQLMMTSGTPINAPETEWGHHGERNWTVGDKCYVAVATCEVGGKKYMVALFQTTAEKNPDYKPNQNPDKN